MASFSYHRSPSLKAGISVSQLAMYAGPCLMVWSTYFLAFFPGMMSRDSLGQWRQVMTFQFDDWHPAFGSYLYWLLSRVWFSPAIICVVQMLALAAVFAYSMGVLQRRGLPTWLLVAITLFFSLFPLNGFFVNTLFKDVPFGIAVLLLFAYTVEIVESKGDWLGVNRNVCYLTLTLAFIWLIRHSGALTSLAVIGCLALFYRAYLARIAVLAAGCLLLVYAVKGPLYKAIGVGARSYALELLLSHQIGAAINHGAQLTETEKNVLDKVLPLPLWKTRYTPYECDGLVFHKSFNYGYLTTDEGRSAYIRTWYSIMKRNLPALARHQVQVSELVWRLDHSPGSYTYANHPLIDENDLGLKTKSVLPVLHKYIMEAHNFAVNRTKLRVLFYRPALYTYLSLFFFALSLWLVKDKRYVLVGVPLVSIVGSLVLTIPAQHGRYLYPCFLLAPFLAGYCWLHCRAYYKQKRLAFLPAAVTGSDYSGIAPAGTTAGA